MKERMPIYLDNAATSYPKPEAVYNAIDETLRTAGGNPGRGGHQLALAANRIVLTAREALAGLFGVSDSSRFVFTANATMAINLALFGLLKAGDRVVTTTMEHNAVVRPLRHFADHGVSIVRVAADAAGRINPADFCRACLAGPTRLAVLGHVSNVTGTIQPLPEIARFCREHGIVLLVDGSQSAGVIPLDFEALGIDLFAAPGHKGLLGPTGTGFLYVRDGLELQPLLHGGTGAYTDSDRMPAVMPERLECGTPNTPGLAGLAAGIAWIEEVGPETILRREQEMLERLYAGLAGLPGIALYGPSTREERSGLLSFTLDGTDPAEVGYRLDQEYGICVRVGLHCAPEAHRTIGTYPRGTVRVSPGPLSTDAEIETFLGAVAAMARTCAP